MKNQSQTVLSGLLICFFCSTTSLAADSVTATNRSQNVSRESELQVRYGVVSNGFSGKSGEYIDLTTMKMIDLDYSLYLNPKNVLFFRMNLAEDNYGNRVGYQYAGAGRRYFFDTGAKLRVFTGAELGVAQTEMMDFGTLLQSTSNAIELGAHLGVGYQFSQKISAQLLLGRSYGLGFDSISTYESHNKATAGLSYLF